MDTQTIRCEVQDYIALVIMDRPPVNAVNAQFLDDMMLVFDTLWSIVTVNDSSPTRDPRSTRLSCLKI